MDEIIYGWFGVLGNFSMAFSVIFAIVCYRLQIKREEEKKNQEKYISVREKLYSAIRDDIENINCHIEDLNVKCEEEKDGALDSSIICSQKKEILRRISSKLIIHSKVSIPMVKQEFISITRLWIDLNIYSKKRHNYSKKEMEDKIDGIFSSYACAILNIDELFVTPARLNPTNENCIKTMRIFVDKSLIFIALRLLFDEIQAIYDEDL